VRLQTYGFVSQVYGKYGMLTAGALGAAKGFRLMRLARVGSMLGGELVCMETDQPSREGKDVDETKGGLVVCSSST
jgi:hypothetical protein